MRELNSGWPEPEYVPSASLSGSDVAVQRYVDRPADHDGDQAALPALANPERPGLGLRIADARDDALVEGGIADAVDDDVVALILKHADRLIGVAVLGRLRRC